jgi:hypothetical protein
LTQDEFALLIDEYKRAYEAANEKDMEFTLTYKDGWVRFSDKPINSPGWRGFRVAKLLDMIKTLKGRVRPKV